MISENYRLKKKIIVSNGFSKTPIANVAEELNKYGALDTLLTATYPFQYIIKIINFFSLDKISQFNRLKERKVNIEDNFSNI